MTENIIVQYFPPNSGSRENDLGGGYVTSGIFKTRFKVIRTDKNPNGFFVSLPSAKNANGEYKDIVSTINKEASDMLSRAVSEAMNRNPSNARTTNKSPAGGSPAKRNLAPKTPVASGIPGDDAPWWYYGQSRK